MKKSPLSDLWEKQGFSESSVADLVGVQEWTVRSWASGESFPDVHQAIALSELCRCDLKDIYLAVIRTPPADPDA